MNNIFLLNLIAELIKEDQPTAEQIKCARIIVDNLIKTNDKVILQSLPPVYINSQLDEDAIQARKELTGEIG